MARLLSVDLFNADLSQCGRDGGHSPFYQKTIWVILLKTGQNCDIEGKNSKCQFFNAIIWK